MLTFDRDIYQGITIHNKSIPNTSEGFTLELSSLITDEKNRGTRIIWLTLLHQQARLIACATEQGFVFHSCHENEIILILRLLEDVYVPFSPTHTIGLGGIVIKHFPESQEQPVDLADLELLVIKERLGSQFKFPGGHMELNETIVEGVIREVYEETGIKTAFHSIISVASRYPYQLGKSNIYLACLLTPLTDEIEIYDVEEIEEAKWVNCAEFMAEPTSSNFAKSLIESALASRGLMPFPTDFLNITADAKYELFNLC